MASLPGSVSLCHLTRSSERGQILDVTLSVPHASGVREGRVSIDLYDVGEPCHVVNGIESPLVIDPIIILVRCVFTLETLNMGR